MTSVDQFESMFRAAAHEQFQFAPVEIKSVLVVTDCDAAGADGFTESVQSFLSVLGGDADIAWRTITGSQFDTAGALLELVESAGADLICTYRNLHSTAWKWPYSLGTHLDLLTQHTHVPVMVLPHPEAERSADHAMKHTQTVMVTTDHLTGDAQLVNFGARFTKPNGTLWLTHVEDDVTFSRYMNAVSKIPTIDTDEARTALRDRLLVEPRDYIAHCREVLATAGVPLRVEELVTFGHHLSEYEKLIEKHKVDLLVLNTKDDGQMAMHGMAYALAVGLRQIPLLML